MNGFSHINKVGTSFIHLALNEAFNIDDVDEIHKFRAARCKIILSDVSEKYEETFANLIKYFDSECPYDGLLKVRLIDYLIESSENELGILLVMRCSMNDGGMKFRNLIELIEAISVAVDSWIKKNRPFHVVICDEFPSALR